MLPSVKFLGALGDEKYEHLTESLVSVPNPTGQTETCCVSAIEMQACGAAVVSGAYYALLGTVHHNQTGLLGRGDNQLTNNICYLLENPEVAIDFGENGKARVRERYDFEVVSKQWMQLFSSIDNGKVWKPKHEFKYIRYHRKWLRMANYYIKKLNMFNFFLPSVQEVEHFVINFVKNAKNR